jgi:hypothetical protein
LIVFNVYSQYDEEIFNENKLLSKTEIHVSWEEIFIIEDAKDALLFCKEFADDLLCNIHKRLILSFSLSNIHILLYHLDNLWKIRLDCRRSREQTWIAERDSLFKRLTPLQNKD